MTNGTNHTNPETTKSRRWFRFRLRTLLVMVTLLSVPLGWVGWELDQRRREKAVVKWVEEMGGEVDFSSSLADDERSWWERTKDRWLGERARVLSVNLSDTHVSDLSPLTELKNLVSLYLVNPEVSDLSPLAELKNLKTLYLHDTKVSDLSPLVELKNLTELYVADTEVSNLSPLAKLKNLEKLDVGDTEVTDLSPLAELNNLESLYLWGTRVNDPSPLTGLKKLKTLSLRNTPVSKEQIEELRMALPNCEIRFD